MASQMLHPHDEVILICIGAELDVDPDYKQELIQRILKLLQPYQEKVKQNQNVSIPIGDEIL